jgi:hypothetical protein
MKSVYPVAEVPNFVQDKNHIYNKLTEAGINSVDVGYRLFKIELHSNLCIGEDKKDGVTELDTGIIKLELTLPDDEARETIMHEILHCVLEPIGLSEDNFDGDFIRTTNEVIANTLAKQLRLIQRLNPGLLATLFPHEEY